MKKRGGYMPIDNLLEEIKKETRSEDLIELIDCITDFSLSSKVLEQRLIKAGKISFKKNNDKKNKKN